MKVILHIHLKVERIIFEAEQAPAWQDTGSHPLMNSYYTLDGHKLRFDWKRNL